MLFHTMEFVVFFAVVMVGYGVLFKSRWRCLWLLLASYVFYGWWNPLFLLLIIYSSTLDYLVGRRLEVSRRRKAWLIVSLVGNLMVLSVFKYSGFLTDNLNILFSWLGLGLTVPVPNLLLPVGISFFTFQSMSYSIDVYNKKMKVEHSYIRYLAFVALFPQLVAGPIERAAALLPQLRHRPVIRKIDVSDGLSLFLVGLFKKVAMADFLSIYVDKVYGDTAYYSGYGLALATAAFAWQIYFDFSGYTDMAIGAALVFNIRLPINFNSPYKATNIKEFWQRWHITLSRFLLNYVYIPLGGNRKGEARTLANILLLFIVCGLWHGAAWSFVLWGGLTGLASIVYRLWTKTGLKLPKAIAWIVYFGFFNISAVFFRAQTWPDTVKVLKGMLGLSGIYVSPNLADNPFWQKLTVIGIRFGEWRENLPDTDTYLYFLCFLLIPFVLLTKNSNELLEKFSPNWKNAMAVSLMMIAGLLLLNKTSSFLYFNF